MSTHNLCFEQKYEKYQNFLSENFHFLVVKLSIYLNRQVFVMPGMNGLLYYKTLHVIPMSWVILATSATLSVTLCLGMFTPAFANSSHDICSWIDRSLFCWLLGKAPCTDKTCKKKKKKKIHRNLFIVYMVHYSMVLIIRVYNMAERWTPILHPNIKCIAKMKEKATYKHFCLDTTPL